MNQYLHTKLRSIASLEGIVLVIAGIITISWLWGTVAAIQKNFLLEQEAENLQQQIAVQRLRNQNLAYEQNYYKSAEYLELSARQYYNLASPGEKLLILPPNTVKSDSATSEAAAIGTQKRSNFEQWMYFFFGDKTATDT